MRKTIIALCVLILTSSPLVAQTPAAQADDVITAVKALQKTVEDLKKTVDAQQGQIDTLKQENSQLKDQMKAPPSPATTAPPPPPPTSGQAAQSAIPEISAVVDIVGTLSESKKDEEGNDRLSTRELELTLASDIDPFARFNATVTWSDFESPEVEEAYVTYFGLPYDVIAKVGRMRPRVGIASSMHRDQLDTVDDPLVVQEYLGTEGLFKTGLELSKYLPQFNKSLTQEIVAGILEGGSGDGGEMFGETKRRPTYYAHLRNYWQLSDTSNLELGATFMHGSADPEPGHGVNALGLDFTAIHNFSPLHKLKWQNELYYQSRAEATVFDKHAAAAYVTAISSDFSQFSSDFGAILHGGFPAFAYPSLFRAVANGPIVTHYNDNPYGFYSLVDYRLSPRFGIGARYDYVEPVFNLPANPHNADQAISAYFTFYQSEFARLRLQYQHLELADGDDDNVVAIQGTYAVGVHKHALK